MGARRVTRVCMHIALQRTRPSEQPGSAVVTFSATQAAINNAQYGGLEIAGYDLSGASVVNGAAGLSLAPLSGLLALVAAVVNSAHILQ